MQNLIAEQTAARNKSNYLKAKEAFNQNKIEDCISFYAPQHEVKSKQSVKGREGIQKFLEGMHLTWPNIQITVEHAVAEGIGVTVRNPSGMYFTAMIFVLGDEM